MGVGGILRIRFSEGIIFPAPLNGLAAQEVDQRKIVCIIFVSVVVVLRLSSFGNICYCIFIKY